MATEVLGIMVTKYENLDHLAGIVKAARATGKTVKLFLTDEGVKFTSDAGFVNLVKGDGVELSCCEHNCELLGILDKTEGIIYGSQYDNATMLHNSERVLVF
jgi:peroxiredoxin family protein